ncbi:hypothetical protein DFH08DRAFT_978725 [Mycena albidolilacea]|uniref:Uncharacterized protein n=1 Tax=Mycena albidolilacea TaxID=1033008 RepID=A0AAD6YXX8_9AGAR|nr:hypothetical protein DFH08DRAFT_978725 [Mycena albidolilacea]
MAPALDIPLPCDDVIWHASSAAEGHAVMHTPSTYGVSLAQVYGVRMQDTFTVLATPWSSNSSAAQLPLTPFGLFILIHMILHYVSAGAEFNFRTQTILNNWLKIWLETRRRT